MNRELAVLEKLEKELNLKELQIKSLLTITQAINDNVAAEVGKWASPTWVYLFLQKKITMSGIVQPKLSLIVRAKKWMN